MAIDVKCMTCHQQDVITSTSNPFAECESCQRKHGRYVKKWDELTLEEKVENLNSRLKTQEGSNQLIG